MKLSPDNLNRSQEELSVVSQVRDVPSTQFEAHAHHGKSEDVKERKQGEVARLYSRQLVFVVHGEERRVVDDDVDVADGSRVRVNDAFWTTSRSLRREEEF